MIGGIESDAIAACLALLVLLHAVAQAGDGGIILLREYLSIIACQQRSTLEGCQALSCQRPCISWPYRCSAGCSFMSSEGRHENEADEQAQSLKIILSLQKARECPGCWFVN